MTKPRVRLHRDGSVTLLDGFANVISGIGGANAKQRGHGYVVDLSQHELEAAYRSSTWFGKIVDIPADDSTREWRSWKAEKEQIEAIEAEEKRLQVRQKVRQALIWSRLYGGAVIIPGGMPGQPEEPLPVDRVRRGAVKFLTVLHRHDISAQGIVRDPLSPHFGEPEHYEISTGTGQVRFHPSRVIRINGREVPNRNGGSDSWGDSVWMHLSDAILNADAGAAVIGALMQEAKTDVIRLPEMMQNMATAEYESLLVKRLTMTATLKGLSNTLLLDKDDEWDQKQITWAGLPEVMRTLLTIMAGAADIPVTRLTGEQQTGLSGSDAGSLRNYYDAVKAKQELVLSPQIRPLDELLIRSALGDRPDDIWSDWISLYQLSQKERAEVDKLQAEAVKIYADTGMIPADALGEMVQNRLIESASWPGVESAYDASKADLELPPEDDEGGQGGEDLPRRQQAQDAAPRTLYVRRDVLNAAEIIAHFKAQGFSTTLPADDMHVTIAFSRTPVDWMKVGQAWSSEVEVSAGGPRMMEAFGQNGEAKVMLFASSELSWRHEEIKRAGASWDHPEYQPHITISYAEDAPALAGVEPWKGKIVLGPEIFQEVKDDWKASVTEDRGGTRNGDRPFGDAFNPNQPRDPQGRWSATGAQIEALAGKAGQNLAEHLAFAPVKAPATLSRILGIDVRGFRHSVSNQAIAHMRTSHPNLTAADFARLPQIVRSGRVNLGKDRGVNGVPRAVYRAEVAGVKYEYVAEVRRRKRRLDAITFYRL